jgi:hypothetical protein
MALARVVTFEGVSAERIRELASRMQEGEPPEGINPSEMVLLHDAQGERALAIVLFDNEDDYARGDEVLSSMPGEDTPGRRVGVDKYDIAVRVTR